MTGVIVKTRRPGWSRPRLLIGGALVLLAAGAVGGWLGASRLIPQKIAYTKGPAAPLAHRDAPQAPPELQATLDRIAAGYREPVGIAVADVTSGWTAQVSGEETFPQQSVSKLWVALAVMQAVDDRRLSLDQTVVMHDDDRSVFYQPLASRIR
jgi:beta-lactamase class A